MSHFHVLVIGPDPELQLAPFQENNMGDCPEEYLVFHDTEEEHQKEYKTETVERVVMPDGRLLSPYDNEFLNAKKKPLDFVSREPSHVVPSHLEKRKFPLTEVYPTFDRFMEDYHGVQERDPKTGKHGYWENPNKKWDWYQLGGRWKGFFKLKNEALLKIGTAEIGESGVFKNDAKFDADQALKGDIDFEFMMDYEAKKAQERYEKIESYFGGALPKLEHTWTDILDKDEFKHLSIEQKRELYHGQLALKRIHELSMDITIPEKDRHMFVFFDLEKYLIPKEEYIYNARNSAITAFAIIKDGKWFERGSMGWWGIVSDEKDHKEWNNRFMTLLTELPDDTLLSIYDCHI